MARAAAFWLAAALAAQDPAPPVAKWEITAPRRDWYDAAQLAREVAALRPLVEEHAGLAFRKPPVVRVADEVSWDRVVREEMPGARDHALAVAIMLAFYLPDRDEVVLGPQVAYALFRKPADEKDRSAANARTVIAHELTHALAQQHFALSTRMRAERDREKKWVLRAMSEGFSTFVEARVAAAGLGYPEHRARMLKTHERNSRMEYVRGERFCVVLAAEGGAEAVHAALRAEPLSLAAFVKVALKKPKAAADAPTSGEPPRPGKGRR